MTLTIAPGLSNMSSCESPTPHPLFPSVVMSPNTTAISDPPMDFHSYASSCTCVPLLAVDLHLDRPFPMFVLHLCTPYTACGIQQFGLAIPCTPSRSPWPLRCRRELWLDSIRLKKSVAVPRNSLMHHRWTSAHSSRYRPVTMDIGAVSGFARIPDGPTPPR